MTDIWTPVALSQDVPPGVAIPAQLGGQGLVVWRSTGQHLSVWQDRCPHRGMRLSHGFVRGEFLSCIYHGWRYGADGQCRKIPAHPELSPPEAIKVPGYATIEASGAIWVAPEGETSVPPQFPGFTGFRSIRIHAAAEELAAVLGDDHKQTIEQCEVIALIQPLPDRFCNLHILAPEGEGNDQLDLLSQAIEALRVRVEKAGEEA